MAASVFAQNIAKAALTHVNLTANLLMRGGVLQLGRNPRFFAKRILP
jgi:hypothetical protein